MSIPRNPTLAATAPDFADLTYPIGAQPKIDGVCALGGGDGVFYSRRLKPFENRNLQAFFKAESEKFDLAGYHGEAITDTDGQFIPHIDKDSTGATLCNRTASMTKTHNGHTRIEWWLHDNQNFEGGYEQRHAELVRRKAAGLLPEWCKIIPLVIVHNARDLQRLDYRWAVQFGYEGTVLKRLGIPYKFGRATVNSGELLRVTAWKTDEAEIIGALEEMGNGNEAKVGATGHLERSGHQENLTPKDSLGALRLRGLATGDKPMWVGVEFQLGTGWDDKLGKQLWEAHKRGELVGRMVTYRHKPHGAKDAPRFPSFRMIDRADA